MAPRPQAGLPDKRPRPAGWRAASGCAVLRSGAWRAAGDEAGVQAAQIRSRDLTMAAVPATRVIGGANGQRNVTALAIEYRYGIRRTRQL